MRCVCVVLCVRGGGVSGCSVHDTTHSPSHEVRPRLPIWPPVHASTHTHTHTLSLPHAHTHTHNPMCARTHTHMYAHTCVVHRSSLMGMSLLDLMADTTSMRLILEFHVTAFAAMAKVCVRVCVCSCARVRMRACLPHAPCPSSPLAAREAAGVPSATGEAQRCVALCSYTPWVGASGRNKTQRVRISETAAADAPNIMAGAGPGAGEGRCSSPPGVDFQTQLENQPQGASLSLHHRTTVP